MGRAFLILQLRPEDAASDSEFAAFLARGGLPAERVQRIRLDRTSDLSGLTLDNYAGVIVGGGPGCVSDPPDRKDPLEARMEAAILSLMPDIVARDIPFLGCCYGIGVLTHYLGGEVSKARYGEPIGPVACMRTEAGAADPLLAALPDRFDALVGHKEAVQALPPGAVHLVRSEPCPFQMIRVGANVYATQFHPEADGEEFVTRIRIYKHYGYFQPEEAEMLKARARAAEVTEPARILAGFVARYGSTGPFTAA
jgi:GMP synthase (glutamine-hydrolysing)